MPSSLQKTPVYQISVHRAGPAVSLDEFRATRLTMADQWLKLSQPQTLTRRLDFAFMNNTMDAYVKAAGWPDPRPILVGKAEFENAASVVEYHKLPEMVQYFSHREYQTDRDVSLFIATADVKFEKQSSLAAANRAHCVAVLEVPEGRSPDECEQRLDTLLDRFLQRPAVQKNCLKLTLFRQDTSMNDSLHEVDVYRFGAYTLVIHVEYANQQDLMETMDFTDTSLQEIFVEALKDFSTPRTAGFAADVITVLEKH